MQRARRNRLDTGHGTREGGAHLKHVVHVRDARRVEAQRLVERRRVLPRHTEAHEEAVTGGWRCGGVWGRWRCTQRARRNRLDTGHGTREGAAHGKHVAHVRVAGRVEAQRLVERRRTLPRHSEAHEEGDTGGWEGARACGGRWRCTQHARRNRMDTGHGTREGAAHVKHELHGLDAGRVETQRLVERRRVLRRHTPRHMRRATQGAGGVRACGGGGGACSACTEEPTGHRARHARGGCAR